MVSGPLGSAGRLARRWRVRRHFTPFAGVWTAFMREAPRDGTASTHISDRAARIHEVGQSRSEAAQSIETLLEALAEARQMLRASETALRGAMRKAGRGEDVVAAIVLFQPAGMRLRERCPESRRALPTRSAACGVRRGTQGRQDDRRTRSSMGILSTAGRPIRQGGPR
jgi:hypothetical protein